MRLLFKELKKLFNPLLVLILLLFTAAYSVVILYIIQDIILDSADYYLPFERELISEFGAEISLDEWDAFSQKRDGLLEKLNAHIRQSDVFAKYGIETYVDLQTKQKEYSEHSAYADAENELWRENSRLYTEASEYEKLVFDYQEIDNYIYAKDHNLILADESDYDAMIAENPAGSPEYAYIDAREKEIATRDYVSVHIPRTYDIFFEDAFRLFILEAIWCIVLILPYVMKERICNVRSMQLATRTGRGIFGVQAVACALGGAIIGMLLNAVYAALLLIRGYFAFFPCDMNRSELLWIDISFGNYLLIHAAAVILLSVCASLATYFIGRLARSYIAGLGLALPVAAALVWGFVSFFRYPLDMRSPSLAAAVIKPCITLLIFAAISAAVFIMLKRDKVRDIL